MESGSDAVPVISYHDSMSGSCAHDIMVNLASIITTEWKSRPLSDQLTRISVAFPGPFDYPHGISLIKGLEKYDAIFGMSIPDSVHALLLEMTGSVELSNVPMVFMHDVDAFAIGMHTHVLESRPGRILYLALGTGAGSAFMVDGMIVDAPYPGVPMDGWIYPLPFKDSCIDEYLSARGQSAICKRVFGHDVPGKELDGLARNGDVRALEVFSMFGKDVLEAVGPILNDFQPDCLVMGGQISKSYSLFGVDLQNLCDMRGIESILEYDTSLRIIQGLAVGKRICIGKEVIHAQ